MAGENCVLTAPGFGQKLVKCVDLSYGIEFEGDESVTRNARTFYPKRQTPSAFSIGLVYSKRDEYQAMVSWLEWFLRRVSDPDQTPISMLVWVPSRQFVQTGVPMRGVGYRETDKDVTWKLDLSFLGVESAITAYDSPAIAQYQKAIEQDETSQYFYPAGTQQDQEAREAQAAKDALAKIIIGGISINQPNTPGTGLLDPRTPGPQ